MNSTKLLSAIKFIEDHYLMLDNFIHCDIQFARKIKWSVKNTNLYTCSEYKSWVGKERCEKYKCPFIIGHPGYFCVRAYYIHRPDVQGKFKTLDDFKDYLMSIVEIFHDS